MVKSVLAISEGGPDAAMAFRLAARIAADFGAIVDGVHFPHGRPDDINIAAQAMPFLQEQDRSRLNGRLRNAEGAWREHATAIAGATLRTGWDTTLDTLVEMGRSADLLARGAYGRGQLSGFFGLGGATGKVISSCPVPVLMAH